MDGSAANNASGQLRPSFEVNEVRGWRRAVLWPLAVLVRLWGRSLRFNVDPESREIMNRTRIPVVMVLWHNRLFLAPEIYRRLRFFNRVDALISASRDGAWLSAWFGLVGIHSVRGSSSRLGPEAARNLIRRLRQGHDLGITPDGPRGPCYDFKEGALVVSRLGKAPVLLLGAAFPSAWRLRSWDRFYLPRPFSRVNVRVRLVTLEELRAQNDPKAHLSAILREINPDS